MKYLFGLILSVILCISTSKTEARNVNYTADNIINCVGITQKTHPELFEGLLSFGANHLSIANILDGAIDGIISSGLSSAVYKTDFLEGFSASLVSTVVNLTLADVQFEIGELFTDADGQPINGGEGSFGHALLHGLAGCAAAEASGASCAAGLASGIAQSFYSGWLATEGNSDTSYDDIKKQAALIGAITGYIFSGGEAGNVSLASSIFVSGIINNACAEEHGGCWTTEEEKELLDQGDYLGYYELACSNGDAYACYARDIASEQGFWGKATTSRLQDVAKENLGRFLTVQEMENIRINLAKGYSELYGNEIPDAIWPLRNEIVELHWDVFESFRLPPNTFGGTPFYDEYDEQAWGEDITQMLTDWCPNCIRSDPYVPTTMP